MKNQTTPLDLFVEAASALWQKHESELDALAAKAEERMIRFGFTVIIDASGTVPRMTVRMAWTERIADEIETPLYPRRRRSPREGRKGTDIEA